MSHYNISASTPVAVCGWCDDESHAFVYAEPLSRFGPYASFAIICSWFGGMKSTEYEAHGALPLMENSPPLSWFYAMFLVVSFSTFLGFVELSIGLLIILRFAIAIFSATGELLSAGLFVTILNRAPVSITLAQLPSPGRYRS